MKRDFPQVAGDATLQELVDRYILAGGVRFFAVRNTDSPAGAVTLAAIRAIPRSAWPTTTVSQVMVPLRAFAV
jgi:hypothetical protein